MESDLIRRSVSYYNEFFGTYAHCAPIWRGRPCQQFPADLFRYARLCWELNPPFVVEIGNAEGGTAMFLSDVMASFGVGKVIAIDINDPHFPALGNLRFQRGDSLDQSVLDYVRQVAGQQRGLVLIDGDHSSAQVLAELEEYSDLADYLVVQDTIMQWLDRSWNDNPHVALSHWLPKHPEFMIDDMKMDTTQHPGGWLKRIGGK